jgi:shikimate dehydrogenase
MTANAPPQEIRPAPRRTTFLAGLIGAGIGASRTPAMHEAEATRLGLPFSYRLLDSDALPRGPADLPTILRAAEICGFSGLNVTYPFKVEVTGLLDTLSEGAARVGAVNTVVLRDGRREGHNTDHSGFAEAFAAEMADAPRERVLLIGAGGAGGAVAQALLDCGVRRLVVTDTGPGRADALARRLRAGRPGARVETAETAEAAAAAGLDGVVNATPVGMAKLPGTPFPARLLHPGLWVADIVYVPLETALLAAARAAGCRTMSGAGMAVFQAVGAFRLFTGVEPSAAHMRATFERLGGMGG